MRYTSPMATPIDKIVAKLSKHPEIRYERDEFSIVVPKNDLEGFDVAFDCGGGRFAVTVEGLHLYFDEEERALDAFGVALSDAARLKVTSRGGRDCQWDFEYVGEDGWVSYASAAVPTFAFWREKRERILQNRHLSPNPDHDPDAPRGPITLH
ncbi:MAG: hypothetical protein KDH09_01035 [Chrysiogenetes bacterium]|nr:hypothetical protein [Chrysiogenetes bacterium]